MPHRAIYSTTSSLTSLSAEASVRLYEETLKPKIDSIRNSNATLQDLVDTAEKIVNEVFASDPRRTFTYTKEDKEVSVQLDKVMTAMLASAEECGGDSAKRYVAAAILSCAENDDVVGALSALGATWVTHFLFIFKAGRQRPISPNETPSQDASPISDQSATRLLDGVGNRKNSFKRNVIRRDGYECALTGVQDLAHPSPAAGILTTDLVAARILRRAVGRFAEDHKSDSYKPAVTTFDILQNFTRLPTQTPEELSAELDNPSNGMTLQYDACAAFDRFDRCLKKTEFENVYDLKIFRNRGIMKKPDNNRITFKDRSNDFSDSTCDSEKKTSVSVPNAHNIEIHAAIAENLHMSGAGKFFDGLLDDYRDDEDKLAAVRCWPELERFMEEQLLRDAITESFQLAGEY